MCQRLATENAQHEGYRFTSTIYDSFEISGLHRQRIGLV